MLLEAAGGFMLGAVIREARAASPPAHVLEIHMRSDATGAVVGFDPVGVHLAPGSTVRWVCDANVHTTTAYSPRNANHSQRIPVSAQPWASGYLMPGQHFEVTLTVEGVYDYYCLPHEQAGMVGRLIVGRPSGPGALPFDYFVAQGRHWLPVPPAAQTAFPSVDDIMRRRVVSSGLNFSA
ncbi:MAG: plastocyanin/azurin family copper-binding protein [Candidatus Binataceae bacterium]